jgi:ketosteroid isomerase-like protein
MKIKTSGILSRNCVIFFQIAFFLIFAGLTAEKTFGQFKPDDQKLYDTIVKLDSEFFGAYNTCDKNLDKYGEFYSENIEFYHDQSGLTTSKKEIIEGTKNNICGKVTRELVKGSIEVYPIKDYGAIEVGFHKFHNNQKKKGTLSNAGRFVIVWQNTNNEWRITRVISLH